MRSSRSLAVLLAGLAVGAAAAHAGTSGAPTITRPGPTEAPAVTGPRVAYAVGETPTRCARVEVWSAPAAKLVEYRDPISEICSEGPSTGAGVAAVSIATTRVLWVSYVGGNQREWVLWTATPTKKAARRLRFASRPVDAPSPIVLGPGVAAGVPYALGKELVYLGDNGKALFKRTFDEEMTHVAAGPGGSELRVVAALASGRVIGLAESGAVTSSWELGPDRVEAVGVSFGRVAIQTSGSVDRVRLATASGVRHFALLPAGARLVGYRTGRFVNGQILFETTEGDLVLRPGPNTTTALVADGTRARRARGAIDEHALAWTIGRTVSRSTLAPRTP